MPAMTDSASFAASEAASTDGECAEDGRREVGRARGLARVKPDEHASEAVIERVGVARSQRERPEASLERRAIAEIEAGNERCVVAQERDGRETCGG